MKIIRFLGILLTFISVLTASAEAVIAFSGNIAGYESLFTSEVCAIILGNDYLPKSEFSRTLMNLPAWVFFGSLGVFMIFISREKKRRNEMVCDVFYRK